MKLLFQHMEDKDLEVIDPHMRLTQPPLCAQEVAVGNARKYVDSLAADSMSVVVNTVLAGYEASSTFSRGERCRSQRVQCARPS